MLVLGCPDCKKEYLLHHPEQAITCECGFVLTDEKSVKVGVKVTVPKITEGKVHVYEGGTVKKESKKIESIGKNHYFKVVETPKPIWDEFPLELKVIYTSRMHATVRMLRLHGFL